MRPSLSQYCRWLQGERDFLPRTAGLIICCYDQKGLKINSHTGSAAQAVRCHHSDPTVLRATSRYHLPPDASVWEVRYPKYSTRTREKVTVPHRNIWYDPKQSSTLSKVAAFHYKVFASSLKRDDNALCWKYNDPGLDNSFIYRNQNSCLKITEVEKNPTQGRISPSILKQNTLSLEWISFPCCAQLNSN